MKQMQKLLRVNVFIEMFKWAILNDHTKRPDSRFEAIGTCLVLVKRLTKSWYLQVYLSVHGFHTSSIASYKNDVYSVRVNVIKK